MTIMNSRIGFRHWARIPTSVVMLLAMLVCAPPAEAEKRQKQNPDNLSSTSAPAQTPNASLNDIETTSIAETSPLRLEIGKSALVRLPKAAVSVYIANPEVADIQVMSPTMIYVFGKKSGETDLFATDADEKILAHRKIEVTHNLEGLQKALKQLFPGRSIKAISVENGIMLTGQVASPVEAEDARRLAAHYLSGKSSGGGGGGGKNDENSESGEIVNHLSINSATQISLRVRISEVSRRVAERFGFNWGAVGRNLGNFTFNIFSGLSAASVPQAPGKISTPTRLNNLNSLEGTYASTDWNVDGLIDALAQDGLITMLAEPNLTAVSGQTANFLAGGEFPIMVPQTNGAVGVEFKQYGVSLAFTPTILDSGRINLHVRPEVSQLSTVGAVTINGVQIPAITTRRAETTVELGSGQSFAIAGLLQNTQDQTISKFPFLGDIPILGALFRSTNFQRDESELVIIVTPYLVQPTDASRLSVPTDKVAVSSPLERILRGRLDTISSQKNAPKLHGPIGLSLEEPR
ncbi:pilus assembly protein CpaC [Azospirillaceae bacterium]